MEKSLIILELDGSERYLLVKNEIIDNVRKSIKVLIDGYNQDAPPMKMMSFVLNALLSIYKPEDVEVVKVSCLIKEISRIWEKRY